MQPVPDRTAPTTPPPLFDTVICGVDGSVEARAAAQVSEGLARVLGSRLVLASIAPSAQAASHPGDAASGGRDITDVSVERLRIDGGDPARRLASEAEARGAGLLVVGRRGSEGVRDAVSGSVSTRLAADAPCPVVVVPPRLARHMTSALWDHRCIVAGFDGSENAVRAAQIAAALAARTRSSLLMVQVVDSLVEDPPIPPPTVRALHHAAMSALAGRDAGPALPLRVSHLVRHGDVPDQLERVATAATASMIVVGSRGRPPWRAALLGSVSRELIERARRPVVVVPPTARAQADGDDRPLSPRHEAS